MKKHVLISSAGIATGLLVAYYFLRSDFKFSSTLSATFSWTAVSALLGILFAYINYFISGGLDKFLPWRKRLASRFLAGIFIHFLVTFLLIIISCYFYLHLKSAGLVRFDLGALIKLGIVILILMLIYNIIYFALYSYYSYVTLQIQTVKYERKQIDLQLKALKSQLSPHLLFNNLNTISSIAFKDIDSAEAYIRGLSTIYRYALNSYQTKLVELHEELNIIRAYFLLLKTRYNEFLSYNIDIKEELKSLKVPPLTLQMLIENAIKHNVVNENNHLQIDIYSSKEHIGIRNNLTKEPENISSFNIGLKNIKSRYQLIYNKNIDIKKNGDFIVEIPLIQ